MGSGQAVNVGSHPTPPRVRDRLGCRLTSPSNKARGKQLSASTASKRSLFRLQGARGRGASFLQRTLPQLGAQLHWQTMGPAGPGASEAQEESHCDVDAHAHVSQASAASMHSPRDATAKVSLTELLSAPATL